MVEPNSNLTQTPELQMDSTIQISSTELNQSDDNKVLVDSANLVDLIVLVEGSGVVENSSVELENNNSAALNHETSVEEAATSKPIEVDEGENETEASSSEESIGADAAGIATKRTSNNPYDVNSTWVHFDSDDLGAFKQTPVRLNLDGRAFYVSVHLKLFDCRLNIGDIVTTFDNTRAVFLGVRLSKQAEEGNRTVLYFCTLPTDDINADIICQSNEETLLQLFMLNPADIKRVFPFTLTDNGLPYEQPHELNIVNVMRKVGIILGESNTDLLLSMEKTACGVDEHTVNTASLKKPANVSASKHLGSLPMKPKSIRGMALPAGNSKATKSCAKVTKALAPPAQRNKSKRVAETEPPVDNHTAKSFKKAKPHSDIQTLHATKQNTFLRSESALSAMTNVELAQLCDRFSIDVPLKSKKSILVQALLNYRDDGARHHREKIESRSEHVFAFSDDEPTVAIVTSTKATKADVNHIFREEAKEFTKSLLNDIKNMKSFNKPIDVTAEPEHDELIRTKATLMEMVEQKKASKEMFQEHLDMFTKVTAIAKEPLLECIKIHSQQMVSLSSNLHVPHQQYLQQAIAPPPFSSSYNQQTVPQATNPPAALISSQQYTPYQQYFVQEQLNSNMPHPWHQTQQQNMMAFQSQHMHQMMSPAAIQQQQQFLSSATLQQPFTNHQHAFSPYQQQHQHLSHHQPGFHMQQQMMFPAGTHCGMQSSFLSVPPQQLTGPIMLTHQQPAVVFPSSFPPQNPTGGGLPSSLAN